MDVIINNRFLNFYFNGLNSDNELEKFIFMNSLLLNYGSVLKKLAYICRNYGISYLNIFEKNRRKFYLNIPHDELWQIKLISELLEIKDQHLFTILNESEVNFMLKILCTG